MKKYLKFIFLLSAFCFLLSVHFCLAEENKPLLESTEGAKYSEKCISDGDCQLNDFMIIFARVAQIVLGITGSLALLAFIYGGVVFLISAGNTEMVAKGKKIIVGAIIGLVIVFASYTIISFVFTTFEVPEGGNWATSGWFK